MICAIIAYRRNPDGTVTIVLRKGDVTAEATGRSQRVAYCMAWDLLSRTSVAGSPD